MMINKYQIKLVYLYYNKIDYEVIKKKDMVYHGILI